MKPQSKKTILVLFSLIFAVFLSSCSSARLKYTGSIITEKTEQPSSFVYEGNYEVGDLRIWCILTAIFYGGACWAYITLPTESMENGIMSDAEKRIVELTGKEKIVYVKDTKFIEQREWDRDAPTFFMFDGKEIISKLKSTP